MGIFSSSAPDYPCGNNSVSQLSSGERNGTSRIRPGYDSGSNVGGHSSEATGSGPSR